MKKIDSYYSRNKEKIKKYQEENKEKILKHKKEYYTTHKNKILRVVKKYQQKNKSKVRNLKKIFSEKDFGLHQRYQIMLCRCNRNTGGAYKYYKAKGIKVLWTSYEDFKKDMFDSYLVHLNSHGKKQTSLDRIDSNNHYSKENCRWATWKQQAENKKPLQG